MKKFVFILCAILVVLLVIWLVMKFNKLISPNCKYNASTLDEQITIYDIDDLEKRASAIIPKASVKRASPARSALASPNFLWQEG